MELSINGRKHEVDVEENMPLLWVLRDVLNMTGTKYGCGIAQCGACTVHIDGVAERSCQIWVSDVTQGQEITTIEGLGTPEAPHPVQQAWIETQVAQCGYCQSGQIMQAASMLADNPAPSDEEINEVMSGNLCRCGSYPKIKRAINLASAKIAGA